MYTAYFEHKTLGLIELKASQKGLVELNFVKEKKQEATTDILKKAVSQLEEYFAGKRTIFELPLDLQGTDFQIQCWNELMKIPYGKLISYSDEAENIGKLKAVRAVANANGRNRMPIIIPCHRVIEKSGKLGGYSAGIEIKKYLLRLENVEM